MSIFSKNNSIQALHPNQIKSIVLEVLQEYDPEIAKQHEIIDSNELLSGTTFWTAVQSIDNYLVGKQNRKVYKILKQMDEQLGQGTLNLPNQPSDTELYNFQLFKFSISIRPPLSEKDKEDILSKLRLGLIDEKIMPPLDALKSFVNNYLIHLQRYELNIAVKEGYGFKKHIEPQLKQNPLIIRTYLKYRPEIAKTLH